MNVKAMCSLMLLCCAMCWMACGPGLSIIPERDYTSDMSQSPGLEAGDKQVWEGAKLAINRADKKVTITLVNGQKFEVAFEVAPNDVWPTRCPGNTSSRKLEVLRLQSTDIKGGSISYKKPILLADCFYKGPEDANPEKVHLVEETTLQSGNASFCTRADKCVLFRTKINCDPSQGPCT